MTLLKIMIIQLMQTTLLLDVAEGSFNRKLILMTFAILGVAAALYARNKRKKSNERS